MQIKYENKTITIPKPLDQCDFGKNPLEQIKVANRFSGVETTLPNFAVAVYDVIMGSNQLAEMHDKRNGVGTSPLWKDVRKGLDWFRQYFAKEYMVLLD